MSLDHEPRVPFIDERDQLPAEGRSHYDALTESRGEIQGPFGVLLHSPELAGRVGRLGAYARFESTLPDSDRELGVLTTARAFDCAFEWAVHAPIAREAGVTEATLEAVIERGLDQLGDREASIVRYGQELFGDHAVSRGTYDAAESEFGTEGLVELTATMGYYAMLACVLNGFDVVPATGTPLDGE